MLSFLAGFALLWAVAAASPVDEGIPSPRWLETGLRLRVVDTIAILDSIGTFEMAPALVFPARRLESRAGAPILCLPDGGESPLEPFEALLTWGPGSSILFRADRRRIRLDPTTGTLVLGKLVAVVPPQSLSQLPSGTSRLRRPVAAIWRNGSWVQAPSVGAGAGALAVPVFVGGHLAALRIDRARETSGGWDLGQGAHLVEFLEEGTSSRIDTLRGSLRLDLAPSHPDPGLAAEDSLEDGPNRIVAYGGVGLGQRMRSQEMESLGRLSRRIDLRQEARGVRLSGQATWSRGPTSIWERARGNPAKPSCRFEDGLLRADTAAMSTGTRVVEAILAPDGSPIGGRLVDRHEIEIQGGRLVFEPGTRLVRGLPALGGPGSRHLLLDFSEDPRFAGASNPAPALELGLEGASPASRIAQSGHALRYRDGTLQVQGLVAVERRELDDPYGRKLRDKFVVVLDSLSVELPGMTDTLGRPTPSILEGLGRHDLFPSSGSASWQDLGPWSQWIDSARPWLVWRFRPGLVRDDGKFLLRTKGLHVAWMGTSFGQPRPGSDEATSSYVFGDSGFRCQSTRRCTPLSLRIPPGSAQGQPWPGLGAFEFDSTVELLDTSLAVHARLIPHASWLERLGPGPFRATIAGKPSRRADGTWSASLGSRPALTLRFAAPPLPRSRTRFLKVDDTLQLASPEGILRFVRRWDEPLESGPAILGQPRIDGDLAVLRELDWSGDDRGAPDLVRERWEALVRPTELLLRDGSRLRALEPLQVFPLREGRILSTEVRGRGLVRVDGSIGFPVARDSVVRLDAKRNLAENPARRTVVPPPLFDRGGMVPVTFPDGTVLRVDRTEVSRARWDSCVVSGPCPVVPHETCLSEDRHETDDRVQRLVAWRSLPHMPMTCVSAAQARAFCKWAGGRLPTATQRRRIDSLARSVIREREGHWPVNHVEFFRQRDASDPYTDLAPVGSLRGIPPGLFDLFGNVEEWCESGPEESDSRERAACEKTTPREEARTEVRRGSTLGFRCVQD